MHRLEQYSREYIEIAEVQNSIINDLLEEHFILIFEKLGVVMEPMDMAQNGKECYRTGKTLKIS